MNNKISKIAYLLFFIIAISSIPTNVYADCPDMPIVCVDPATKEKKALSEISGSCWQWDKMECTWCTNGEKSAREKCIKQFGERFTGVYLKQP